jgi:hypothetical protein
MDPENLSGSGVARPYTGYTPSYISFKLNLTL